MGQTLGTTLIALALLAGIGIGCSQPEPQPEPAGDPFAWLEEIDGERAMAWVEAENERTADRLKASADFASLFEQAKQTLDSESRIPSVQVRAGFLYNFWKDEEHPRGLYRRTTLGEFRKPDPQWQTVLDIDALSEAEGEKWVFKWMQCLPEEYRHCLVFLSPGGGDATVMREFDMEDLTFVEGGFSLPKSKMRVGWRDENSLFVGTDFGHGSLTDSGYPRIVKLWERGSDLEKAEILHEAEKSSVAASAFRLRSDGPDIDLVSESLSFWTSRRFQVVEGEMQPLNLPESASVQDAFRGRLVVSLKEDWEFDGSLLVRGSIVVIDPQLLRGGPGELDVLVEPDESLVVEGASATPDGILVTALDDVRGRLYRFDPAEGGGWQRRIIEFPDNGALSVESIDHESGSFFVQYESFTTPATLYRVAGPDWVPEEVKAQEATFDGSRFAVEQHFATSADGTRVPYFQVASNDLDLDGSNPTHIFSYGGFRASLTPSYSGSYEPLFGAYGKLWLERGGVFVLANIRGGGEFGPDWHSAALLENRHKSFEDFEAVAEDLARRNVTSPRHLGIEGRSNGGLLVAATMLRRPELYGAVVCGVPLTDMSRYHELLAGASWMAEYGDPDDPEMWAYLKTYSPYHNVEEGRDYPPVFFFGSTRDDRVHPGHGRKFAARLQKIGDEVWYYENTEGGHGGNVTNEQLAYRLALAYTHLWNQLR